MAVRMGGKGNVSETHIAWRAASATSSFSSPIIDRGIVYFVNRTGMLQAQSLETGEQLWKKRLPASTWASPISDGSHLYFFCKNGQSMVLDTSAKEPTVISENTVPLTEDETLYGAGAGRSCFILRSGRRIFKIGK
jgi:outer membrane protein assembly factor BamB